MTSAPAPYGSGFTEGVAQADGHTIRYFRAGEGDTLVAIHSAAGLRFSPALDRLAEQYDVVQFALPGWGDEPDDGRDQTLAELADTVYRATQDLGLKSFHLLGTALGGDVALNLALDHPEVVGSLVLEAPGTFREGIDPSQVSVTPEEALRKVRVHPERPPVFEPPHPEAQARMFALISRLAEADPDYEQHIAERLPESSVRTLVVFGDKDGFIPPQNGRTFVRLMPNCSGVLLHDAAHDVQGDRGEDLAALVIGFLAGGPDFPLPPDATLVTP
ncbi:alpha/beta fold hydrolase [Streptomyces griseorubiginosus]|uniref:alpha/beta fold hydrolase n=1 Tax=Streptomyces griseorubiginosus TaxID=67304 RepID=UPI001AD6129B|nr:alpha/beta fold hydrolase [Streptomyces griseorubiginosus]MBO4252337.1 alpha/beta fold hydrolase [Streptomyces griseorubiginosus]